jgi:hypothetical protein
VILRRNLINRLKEDYTSLKSVLSDTKRFKKGTGVKLSNNPEEDSSHLFNKPFIDATSIEAYFINPKKITKFQIEKVGRKRDPMLFKGPLLLVRNGLDTHLYKPKAAIIESDIVYKNSLTGIKPSSKEAISQLKNIVGNIYSDLYPYIAINTFCSIGIEREQTKEYEKFDIPYVEKRLDKYVDEIIKSKWLLYKEQNKDLIDNFKINQLNTKVETNLDKINDDIYKALIINKDSVEYALIDYALNIIRPLMTRDKTEVIHNYLFQPLKINDKYLDNYISLFLSKFNHIYNKIDQKLIVEVRHSNQIIGLFFQLIQSSENDSAIKYVEVDSTDIIQKISVLGNERITDRLFIQKDIRGFEKTGFYIVKPNERKLWHQAIAYLDLNDFMDAILTAGKKQTLNVR